MGVKVYGSATSPFVRKVRILLIEKTLFMNGYKMIFGLQKQK